MPKLFCDLSLATMLALEEVSVINDLKGGDAETREEQQETIVQPWGRVLVPQGIHIITCL